MNREIKFRGKRVNGGEWVYGMTISNGTIKRKINNIFFEVAENKWVGVLPETLGQYTGLKDKDGKEIYEGDILKTPRGFIGQVVFGRAEEECRHKVFGRMVIDCYTTYGWIFVRGDGYRCAIDDELLEGEIIGNIHDNPELMKGGSNEA
ncbi:YopX family protein [Prevotella pallens]|jgi:uncharacterized phage protein (TIGR01671 family)|uniref:YopX family protein n=1 Tax=Prevotella pallens TaxID=60133 RepID=UPI001CABE50A|nr:YopX family protein [Prevotella pallens]MBF1450942.1 hypothetical protein [Prevotella pallens]